MDLDAEFAKLVTAMYASIDARVKAGELTQNEADALNTLVSRRLDSDPDSQDYDGSYDAAGWNASQQCW